MADGKKQPVSFDDIIKAGEPTPCAGQADKASVTNLTPRPSKAQERAARTRHLRQEPPPERSCCWQHQEGSHWRQSGQPSRSDQGILCRSESQFSSSTTDYFHSAQHRSLARIARHLAMAVAPPGLHSQATTATAPPTHPRDLRLNPERTTQEETRPRMEAASA